MYIDNSDHKGNTFMTLTNTYILYLLYSQSFSCQVTLHKASRELSNYAALLVPWEGRIKHIEMYFGSVVASYFTFLRWIFWTNIIQAVIVGAAIMAPEVMFGPDFGTVDHKTIPGEMTRNHIHWHQLCVIYHIVKRATCLASRKRSDHMAFTLKCISIAV